MWIGGDGLMFPLMVVVFFLWAADPRPGGQWLESVRRAALAEHAGPAISDSRDLDDDENALAAYNTMPARLHRGRG